MKEPEHEGGMIGTVKAPALSKLPLSVSEGCFNLFVQDQEDASRKKMLYRMKMHSVEGKTYYFEGFKDIHDDKGPDMWSDTTQLYITIYDGDSEKSAVLGKGKLHIAIADFSKQMTTMKAIRPRNKVEGLKAVAQFGKLFAGEVWDTYAG